MELQRDSEVPLYQQIKAALRLRIETGEWRPGQRVPSEPELCARLGVARGTVRCALAELTQEGWLERRQGSGTYVTRRSLEQDLMRFYSFAREASARGLRLTSHVLDYAVEAPAPGLAGQLALKPGERVVHVLRLRLLEGEPVALETCYLPEGVAGQLGPDDFREGALYDVLEDRCGVRVMQARESFTAVVLGAYEAERLGVSPGAPALSVERVAYAAGDRPVEVRLGLLRGDRCRYHVELGEAPRRSSQRRADRGGE